MYNKQWFNGIKLDSIVKKTIEFFSHDDILNVKCIMADITTNLSLEFHYSRLVKDSDNVMDITKTLNACAKEKEMLSVFVMKDSQEVSLCREVVKRPLNVVRPKLTNCTFPAKTIYSKLLPNH